MQPLAMVRRSHGSIAAFTTEPPDPPTTPPTIVTMTLPEAQKNVAYSQPLVAVDGTTPYTWSVVSGSLPTGVTLGASTGVLSGTPTVAATSTFTIRVTDSASPTPQTDQQTFTLTVQDTSSATYTGVTLGTLLWINGTKVNSNTDPSWKTPYPGAIQWHDAQGVDCYQVSTSSLAGYHDGTLGSWDTYPLTADNSQTNFIGRNSSWSYAKPAFLGIYLPDIWDANGNSTLFNNDAAWTTMCNRMKNLCAWASTHGFMGIGFDWEVATARGPKWKQWAKTGLTEAAARALAPTRGVELMTKMVEGWSTTNNGLRILNYASDFPRSWKKWQECYANFGGNWNIFPDKTIMAEFWEGMTSVSGWTTNNGGIWFIAFAFYKDPQGGQPATVAGWDYALNYDKTYHRDFFNQNFTNPEKIGWGPFGWVGGEAERPVFSVPHVQQQFQRFDAVTPDGIVADYRNGSWVSFDPTAYAAVYAYYP